MGPKTTNALKLLKRTLERFIERSEVKINSRGKI